MQNNNSRDNILFWLTLIGLFVAIAALLRDYYNIQSGAGIITGLYNSLKNNINLTILASICLGYIFSLIFKKPKNQIEVSSSDGLPVIHINHRATTKNLFKDAFENGSEVLILSIMSQHTLREVESLLKKAVNKNIKINILTLDPNYSDDVIESTRLLLQENNSEPQKTIEQVKNAFTNWKKLENVYPKNIEVRKYHSIPSIQGVFLKDEYITLEIMTYATAPDDRIGITLTNKKHPQLFKILQDTYTALWFSADK